MAYSLAKEVFVVGAKRTAFGAFGGTLKAMDWNILLNVITQDILIVGHTWLEFSE